MPRNFFRRVARRPQKPTTRMPFMAATRGWSAGVWWAAPVESVERSSAAAAPALFSDSAITEAEPELPAAAWA